MKVVKKVLALLILDSMLVSLAACGQSAVQVQSGGSSAQPTAVTEGATQAVKDGPLVKYPETVVIKAMRRVDMSWFRFNEGDSFNDNCWTRSYLNDLNIDFEVTYAAVGDDYQQKLTMAIASDNLPDFIELPGKEYQQLASAGKLKTSLHIMKIMPPIC